MKQKYSEYSNELEINAPSIFKVLFNVAKYKGSYQPLSLIYDLSSKCIKNNKYQNLILPRTANKETNRIILEMFVVINDCLEIDAVSSLGLNEVDSYFYGKSMSKYVIDYLYFDEKIVFKSPKIYEYFNHNDYQ